MSKARIANVLRSMPSYYCVSSVHNYQVRYDFVTECLMTRGEEGEGGGGGGGKGPGWEGLIGDGHFFLFIVCVYNKHTGNES